MIQFGAQFQKLPNVIVASKQDNPFTLPAPWNPDETLEGEAGDFKVTNTKTNETYPLAPAVLAEKYEHVEGDTYQTRTDAPVVKEARLPKQGESFVNTREGQVASIIDGVPSVIMSDEGGEFPIPLDKLNLFYKAVDAEARAIVAHVQAIIDGQ